MPSLADAGSFLSGAGNLVGGYLGYKGQKETNAANIAAAREQMSFQERMSNTAYRRAMRDMRAAGLNPMLAYAQGGASSPGGAMPVLKNPYEQAATGLQGIGQAVSATAQSFAKVEQTEAMTKEVIQQTGFNDVMHNERWPRLFATMSPENVAASGLAVMEGISIEKVLAGQNHQLLRNERENLRRFLLKVQGYKSVTGRELTGAAGVLTESYQGLKKAYEVMKQELDKMMGKIK